MVLPGIFAWPIDSAFMSTTAVGATKMQHTPANEGRVGFPYELA